MSTKTRYMNVRKQVDEACEQAGRSPQDVLLLAVSKTVDCDEVALAIEGGATAFGENRPDELLRKQAAFPDKSWHFIGNIQSRRIPDIVSAADLIHSVSKAEHLPKIDKAAAKLGKIQPVLIEVNVSGEESKSGLRPEEVLEVIKDAAGLGSVRIQGLMTMAPRADQEAIERSFGGLAKLRDSLQEQLDEEDIDVTLSDISMGMTEDWPQAIELGTTMVRVGRAIFDSSFE
ncbi:YggS family pyridoxal phosphate-dependent enzyme [Anaerotardibacter muris]|uniref:YggS family pyridoxal phosphate-dependent enzyme n=1 Tax=Anaerotardibacter muris TaxID=2941505 RepID=UPI00204124F2|nr:YggS family pyridoxal phosphate-dependent enzyme [Anaerotardibacter muris]